MKRLLVLLLFFAHSLFCIEVDFDVVIVGSSPISLLEALYHHYTGKKVLILEAESECGGAWKSIGICGLYPVDLGCHTLGQDKQILQFLEEYVGCKMVSIDNPLQPFQLANSPNGFYPQGGCYEIVHNLLYLIKKTEITLLVNHKLESVFVHPDNTLAEITTQGMRLTTSKIVVTPHSDINVENSTSSKLSKPSTRFHHIYMLIEDITPPRFTFRSRVSKGISRLMNLTYFVGLKDANKQLIVVQTYEHSPKTAATCLEIMKEHGLIDPCAFLLKEESYIYEQSHYKANNMKIFEVLDTHNISEITQYIPKWKEVLPRF